MVLWNELRSILGSIWLFNNMRILLGLDVVKEVIIFEFFIAVLIMIFTPNESNFMGTQRSKTSWESSIDANSKLWVVFGLKKMLRISSSFWVHFEAAVRSLGILTGYDDDPVVANGRSLLGSTRDTKANGFRVSTIDSAPQWEREERWQICWGVCKGVVVAVLCR